MWNPSLLQQTFASYLPVPAGLQKREGQPCSQHPQAEESADTGGPSLLQARRVGTMSAWRLCSLPLQKAKKY